MKGLDHNMMYYRGLGNLDYQECSDKIKKKTLVFVKVMLIETGMFLLMLALYYHEFGLTFLTGVVFGMFLIGLTFNIISFLTIIHRLELRIGEIE